MIKINNKKRGFTLIELMIVITVIAILSTVALFAYTTIQQRARDSRRKAEIRTIQTAVIAYYTDQNVYPANLTCLLGGGVAPCLGTTKYLGSVPIAPSGTVVAPGPAVYTYSTPSTATFGLCVGLEVPATANMMWNVGGTSTQAKEIAAAAGCTAD